MILSVEKETDALVDTIPTPEDLQKQIASQPVIQSYNCGCVCFDIGTAGQSAGDRQFN